MNGIQRIQKSFEQSKIFAGFLTAGDDSIPRTLDAVFALIAGGVNLLEIGVPFSDPIADGPVIQRATYRALNAKTTLKQILILIETIRKKSDIPIVLFSYLNPILSKSTSTFFKEAAQCGVDGLLLLDCPLEEADDFHPPCYDHGIAPINIIAPTTSSSRLQDLDRTGKGFLYYACRQGTTGIRTNLPDDFPEKMQSIKSIVKLPVLTGFGISSYDTAKEALKYADGVVIGSLFVKALEEGITAIELEKLVTRINPLLR